jgi:hypothetical protein
MELLITRTPIRSMARSILTMAVGAAMAGIMATATMATRTTVALATVSQGMPASAADTAAEVTADAGVRSGVGAFGASSVLQMALPSMSSRRSRRPSATNRGSEGGNDSSKIRQVSAVPSTHSVCRLDMVRRRRPPMSSRPPLRRSAALILALAIAGWLLMIATASAVLIADQGIKRASTWADLALRWCLT